MFMLSTQRPACTIKLAIHIIQKLAADSIHRYLNKRRLLKFCCMPATSAAFSKGIFVATTNSTNQKHKTVGAWHYSVYLS